jgi:hypothetical protein
MSGPAMETQWRDILEPRQSSDRTAALRTLWERVSGGEAVAVPAEVQAFLDGARADDAAQAALIGLVQIALHPERGDEPGVLARIFPALRMADEPDLRRAAIAAFGDRSPREVFDRLVDLFEDDRPADDIDRYYAMFVLGGADVDALGDDAAGYAGA